MAAVGRPVAAWDIDGEGAAATAKQCASEHGVATHAVGIDVRDRAAVAAAVAPTVAALGSVGGLAHPAGIVPAALEDVVDTEAGDGAPPLDVRPRGRTLHA